MSVDTKKKEWVGEFKHVGEEWQPQGEPVEVNVHDFPDKKLGKAIAYGVYDLASNEGWVSVGIDDDTAQFAVTSIGRWLAADGIAALPAGVRVDDSWGRGRQQREPQPLVEVGAARAGKGFGPGAACVPFPTRNQQVEQD